MFYSIRETKNSSLSNASTAWVDLEASTHANHLFRKPNSNLAERFCTPGAIPVAETEADGRPLLPHLGIAYGAAVGSGGRI